MQISGYSYGYSAQYNRNQNAANNRNATATNGRPARANVAPGTALVNLNSYPGNSGAIKTRGRGTALVN